MTPAPTLTASIPDARDRELHPAPGEDRELVQSLNLVEPAAPRLPTLSQADRFVASLIGVATAALGVLGFVNSFHEVARAVEPSFGGLAWTAPIGIDLGIAVFTGLDLFLARLGMRLGWLRMVPWTLVAITIALNVAGPAGRGDWVGAGAHGALPLLWVIAVEVAAHVMRHWAGLGQSGEQRRAAGRMDRIRASRYVLAPVSSLRIRRLMILWEERSYQAALGRWKAKRRARGHMAKRYGLLKWRWKAPIDQRLDYRDADYTLATAARASAHSDDTTSPPSMSSERGSRTPDGGPTRRRQGAAPTKGTLKADPDVTHRLPAARKAADELAAKDLRLNRDNLRAEVQALGESLSNADAGPVIRALRAEGYA